MRNEIRRKWGGRVCTEWMSLHSVKENTSNVFRTRLSRVWSVTKKGRKKGLLLRNTIVGERVKLCNQWGRGERKEAFTVKNVSVAHGVISLMTGALADLVSWSYMRQPRCERPSISGDVNITCSLTEVSACRCRTCCFSA